MNKNQLRREFEKTKTFKAFSQLLQYKYSESLEIYIVDDYLYQDFVNQINAAWMMFLELKNEI